MTARKTAFLLDALPPELREGRSFVGWKYETRNGKKTKPPVNPTTGKHANSSDPSTWSDISTALNAVRKFNLDGIGRVVSDSDPYTGVDLDKCLDEKGELSQVALSIVRTLNSYTEVTPSGRGVRVWIRAKLPPKARNRIDTIEIYSRSRFFTLTGRRLKDTPPAVETRQAELDEIHRTLFSAEPREGASGHDEAPQPKGTLGDEELLSRARRQATFSRLFDGDVTAYGGDASRADYHLCRALAYWTGKDSARIERLFSQSKLALRDKWRDRADYRAKTIERAIHDAENTWNPGDGAPAGAGEEVSLSLVSVRASEVVPSHLEWLWPNRIPLAKLTVFCGPPDVGKSAAAIDIIARGTTGKEWPDAENTMPPFDALMLIDEDNLSDTVVPRLIAAGANLQRVHFATQTKITGKSKSEMRHITLDADLAAIVDFLGEHPNVKLVVIDPLGSYLGSLKKNAEEEIRHLLIKARELAERCGVAVLSLDHFNKNFAQAGIHRLSGAGALAAVPRAVWAFVKDPSDEERLTRLMLNIKLNVISESGKSGLRYRFAKAQVLIGDKTADLPVMDWKGGTTADIDDVLQTEADPAERRGDKAAKFLAKYLSDGAHPSAEIMAEAKKAGIFRNALFEAKDVLEVRVFRVSGSWWWELATDPSASTAVH